jgi:hypothetical protein
LINPMDEQDHKDRKIVDEVRHERLMERIEAVQDQALRQELVERVKAREAALSELTETLKANRSADVERFKAQRRQSGIARVSYVDADVTNQHNGLLRSETSRHDKVIHSKLHEYEEIHGRQFDRERFGRDELYRRVVVEEESAQRVQRTVKTPEGALSTEPAQQGQQQPLEPAYAPGPKEHRPNPERPAATTNLGMTAQETAVIEAAKAVQLRRDGQFRETAQEAGVDRRPPADFDPVAQDIRTARKQTNDAQAFAEALVEKRLELARVTKDEARASAIDEARASREGRYAPGLRKGEYVVVTEQTQVYRLTPRTTGESFPDTQKFMSSLDTKTLRGVEPTKQAMQGRAEQREIERQAFRDLSAVGLLKREGHPQIRKREDEPDASIDSFNARASRDQQERREQGKIDPDRFRSDPDYRREIATRAKEKVLQEGPRGPEPGPGRGPQP